jgi:hypothetical protein
MKPSLLCGLAAVMILLPLGAAFGDTLYDFENPPYVVGQGVIASTGTAAWHYWGQAVSGVDAVVMTDPANAMNQVLNMANPTSLDVVTNYFTSPLSGSVPRLSLDVYLTSGTDGVADNFIPQVNWGPGSLFDAGNYANVQCNWFREGTSTAYGNWSTNNGTSIADLSIDEWHHLDIFATDLGDNVSFSFYHDGIGSNASLTLPKVSEGLNAIEIGAGSSDGNANTYVLLDNLAVVVPEPSSAVLLGAALASVGWAFWRRRRK